MSIDTVAVLGAGSWGTTFAKVLTDAGRSVRLWTRRTGLARQINDGRENLDYLPGIRLPDGITATSDVEIALAGVDAVVCAVPSQALRENMAVWRDWLPPAVPIVSLAKGVEIGTGLRMSEVIASRRSSSTRTGWWCSAGRTWRWRSPRARPPRR